MHAQTNTKYAIRWARHSSIHLSRPAPTLKIRLSQTATARSAAITRSTLFTYCCCYGTKDMHNIDDTTPVDEDECQPSRVPSFRRRDKIVRQPCEDKSAVEVANMTFPQYVEYFLSHPPNAGKRARLLSDERCAARLTLTRRSLSIMHGQHTDYNTCNAPSRRAATAPQLLVQRQQPIAAAQALPDCAQPYHSLPSPTSPHSTGRPHFSQPCSRDTVPAEGFIQGAMESVGGQFQR